MAPQQFTATVAPTSKDGLQRGDGIIRVKSDLPGDAVPKYYLSGDLNWAGTASAYLPGSFASTYAVTVEATDGYGRSLWQFGTDCVTGCNLRCLRNGPGRTRPRTAAADDG